MTAGIYIHVPFCLKKCSYCDFFSVGYDEETVRRYTDAVVRNLRRFDGVTADTVFFGGGTPSLLSPAQISRILSAINISDGAEITLECNPVTAGNFRFAELKSAGINRLSVGVQSLSDNELKASGRLHSAEQAAKTIRNAYSSGIENISADIILGLPCQTLSSLEHTLNGIVRLPLKHISAYMLTVAENTPLAEDTALLGSIADDDTLADMYLFACRFLGDNGFFQYEISNFSAHSFECRHNLKYWKCEPYIGIGPASHSCFGARRYFVPKDIADFISNECQTEITLDDSPCGEQEKIMLGLRLREGIPASEELIKRSAALEKAGFLTVANGRISLTEKGFLMSNEIICRLTDDL